MAVDECGPPPFAGGTVTCPAGDYPDGITYFTTGETEFRLEPGFAAQGESRIIGTESVRVVGPIDTSFDLTPVSGFPQFALYLEAFAPVFVHIDDVSAAGPRGTGVFIIGFGSVTFIADSVTGTGTEAVVVLEQFWDFVPPMPTYMGTLVRTNSVATTGDTAIGIETVSEQGDAVVESGTVTTTGNASRGIWAIGNSVRIDSGTVATQGSDSPGIVAAGRNGASVVSGSVTTQGANSAGIMAGVPGAGTVSVTSDQLTTGGDSSPGISANGDGTISVTSQAITTAGNGSDGIRTLDGAISIESGTIRTAGDDSAGITAVALDDGDIAIVSGDVSTLGSGHSAGIRARTDFGDISITSGSVDVRGNNASFDHLHGIHAASLRGDILVDSGSVSTAGNLSDGIRAETFRGDVTVIADSTDTAGNSAVALLATSNEGNVSVRSGSVSATGFGSGGIHTQANNGDATVIADSASTLGQSAAAILASATGVASVTAEQVTTAGPTSAGIRATGGEVIVSARNVGVSGLQSEAIIVTSETTSAVTVRGLVQSILGFAVQANGGAATLTIVPGGAVRGTIDLTENADHVDNSGAFDVLGINQFRNGVDLFENEAGGIVRSVGGAATLASLETFDNRGLIEMRDGMADDSLSISGAYSGMADAQLALDVDFAAGTADRLITGTATGSTQIQLQGSAEGGFTAGILLVDAGAGTSPTAFTLAPIADDTPYLRSRLRFDAAGNDFLLVALPGAAVFETARFAGMASRLWHESADAVAAQLDTVRDGSRGRNAGLWLQGWTSEGEDDSAQSFGGETFDVSFEQDFQGLQGGFDFQSGSAAIGITAGVGRSDAVFTATGNPVEIEVRNIGLYAQGRAGPLFFNALAKRDWAELEIAPGAGLGAEFDADLFGVQANAGLRVVFGAVFAEPSVGLSWVQADVDSFASGSATVEPGDADSLRARAGLRLGARLALGGGALLPFFAVNVFEELDDGNASAFTLGETLRLFDEPADTRGQAAAGLSFVLSGFEAFVRGEMDLGGSDDLKAVRAGARLRF